MSEDQPNDEDEEIDINDPRLPDALREHGKRFKKLARWIIAFGRQRIFVVFRRFRAA